MLVGFGDCDVGAVVEHGGGVVCGVDFEGVVADVAHAKNCAVSGGGWHFDGECEVGNGDHVVSFEVVD